MNRNMFNSRKSRCAFTLVELLVVVAIIALLISILLPTLDRANEQARMVICASNLKGLGLAFSAYTTANDWWYPAASACGGVIYGDENGNEFAWDTTLRSNYGSLKMIHCPSDKIDRSEFYVDYDVPEGRRHPKSYGMNGNISYMANSVYCESQDPKWGNRPPYPWPANIEKVSAVTNQAETILLADMWDSDYGLTYGSTYYHYAPNVYGAYQGSWLGLHYSNNSTQEGREVTFYHRDNSVANILFCDGHVKLMSEDEANKDSYYYYYRVKP